jgi:2-succinyl-6-hydroxy-2,4-cyclohexadiene-1-carboxylate synthase
MTSGAFTVAVEGAVLTGERRGSGPPLVFLHGMGGTRHDWDRVIAALPADRAILRYDLRGFGQSTAEEGVLFSHTDDLLAVLDTERIEDATLIGLSMGGGVALNFALSRPRRTRGLVLVSPAMVGWEWSDAWKAIWRSVAEAARAGDLVLARERWWQHPMFAAARESECAAELRRGIEAFAGRQWVHDDQRDELPDVERLHELAVPTLLLTGGRDAEDIRLIAEVIAGAAPNVTRIDFAAAGHVLNFERPKEVAEAIEKFAG